MWTMSHYRIGEHSKFVFTRDVCGELQPVVYGVIIHLSPLMFAGEVLICNKGYPLRLGVGNSKGVKNATRWGDGA